MWIGTDLYESTGSLPHRQLRKATPTPTPAASSSLPHRQLRNSGRGLSEEIQSSLPHRQLRNHFSGPSRKPSRSLPHRQLRNAPLPSRRRRRVHCRIGSSENKPIAAARYAWVHCRIGSSEMAAATSDAIWRILLSLDFAERINNTIARQVKTQCVRVDSRGTLTCLGQESVNIFDVPHEPQPDHRPCDARLLFADCD